VDELIQDDLDAGGIDAEGLGRSDDALHVAVMVGSPDVDDPIEAVKWHMISKAGGATGGSGVVLPERIQEMGKVSDGRR
jgi:hypothetical protein